MWRSAAPTVSASSGGRLSERSHLAALNPERVRARRLALKPAHQYRVHLVLRPGARADQLLAARQPPTHNAGPLIGHPHRLEFPLPQPARERARVEPVGLRARLGDPCVIRADHDHPVHIRLEDPCDLPSSTAHLHRDPVRRHKARGQRLERLRCCRHPAGGADHPVLTDRHLTEITVQVKADRSTHPLEQRLHGQSPPNTIDGAGEPAGERHRPIRARGTIRASRRGGHRKAQARSPSSKTARRLRSPKRPPSPITRPYARGQTKPPGNRFSCPDEQASHGSRRSRPFGAVNSPRRRFPVVVGLGGGHLLVGGWLASGVSDSG